MKFMKRLLPVLAFIVFVFPLTAKEKQYDDNDIKRILYLKKPAASSPARYVVLDKILNSKQLECIYLGTQQTLTVSTSNVVPMMFYEDSSNFMITQYALYGIFTRQKPNLPLGLAKINNDNTGRVTALSNFATAIRDIQNNISHIRKNFPPNSNDQANALADLISKDKTLSLIKQAASSGDWVLALTLFDNYKTDVIQLYTRYFANMPDVIKEAQLNCADCENELLLNFANKLQQSNMRRTLFLQIYPQARGLWSQSPPSSYEQLRNVFIRSMNSYHKLDKISRIFTPQDWGSAMLDSLLLLEGSRCAADLEREFDDEMRRLKKRSGRP
ncbi:MAG: hypothetical protein IKD10_06080 [Lentisphaeria bacterium]|nr:hypothetical protein [Lentisphaeria bacterium]